MADQGAPLCLGLFGKNYILQFSWYAMKKGTNATLELSFEISIFSLLSNYVW